MPAAAASPIVLRYRTSAPAAPKHARLREAIIGALEAGELAVGSQLTPERELSEALGLSLGTTQKALGRLMDEGFLVRRQGHGTFVGSDRKSIAGSWHFRFVPPEGGEELPVFTTILERRLVRDEGPWSRALGNDPKGYVMVLRQVDVGGEFTCASRMYLQASRFGKLLRMAEKRLADTNLKEVLAAEFRAPTLDSQGLAFVVPLTGQDAALAGVADGTTGLQVHITCRSVARQPITFQLMSVPPVRFPLKLDFNPPGA